MDGSCIRKIGQTASSFYVYEEAVIRERAHLLQRNFPDATFLYSLKCNPNRHLAAILLEEGFGLDAASIGEVRSAREYAPACAPAGIYWSAPGKKKEDIAEGLDASILVADSPREVEELNAVASSHQKTPIGIRINPSFSFAGGSGLPSKFGIDEEQLPQLLEEWKAFDHISIAGIHVHLQSQELDTAVLARYWQNVADLSLRIRALLGHDLAFINFGSGIGIPGTTEKEADIAALGKCFAAVAARLRSSMPSVRLLLETGRFVMGPSGTYVTTVVDRKISHGRTYVILDGTLSYFLRPCIVGLVTAIAGTAPVARYEPLFSSADAFSLTCIPREHGGQRSLETVTLAGRLCTAMDTLATDISLPHLEIGDFLAISNAGSYARVLSPMQFSSLPAPGQFLQGKDGCRQI